ncbi:putative phospholipase B-like 2 [Varroa jacobsoni]|uniref:putative phospholipase B-like 2 n=1 Tax=Varroa jacobsoni TaxID=62625 RepID=UPI000BF5DC0B|nr:putative phospholipase B-like 2 [Varroa jacobsoni]
MLAILGFVLVAAGLNQATIRTGHVTWDSTNGRFEFNGGKPIKETLATGTFDDSITETGWGFLEIHTNSLNGAYLDYHQAYAAGLLEARLTKDLIEKQWRNEYQDYCDRNAVYCEKLHLFLQTNLAYMLEMVEKYSFTVPYWHQVGLVLVQLAGIESGIRMEDYYVYVGENLTPNISNIMQMNLHGDLCDLEKKLGKLKEEAPGAKSSCSALIALTEGDRDLLAGHNTWTGYNAMLRIQKRFTFQYHKTFDSNESVPGNGAAFSSYPGRLISGDDFYVLSSGLVVTETTIENNNKHLYSYTTPRGTVPSWIRNIVANRLAASCEEWVELYAYNNSGTYNNQWMILNYNLFRSGEPLPEGAFYVLEQMPGYVQRRDMSWFLQKYRFWPSYNIAYFPDIFNISGQWDLVKKYGDWYTYDKTARALIFQRDHGKAVSVEGLRRLLRYNDYKNDPLSKCNCTPPYSAENTVAARGDLNPANGTYPFPALGHRPRGAIDVKVTNSTMVREFAMLIQCGPTNDQQPTFSWRQSDFNQVIRHEGQPDVFNFPPVLSRWMKPSFD